MSEFVQGLDAISRFAAAVAIPAIVVVVLIKFGSSLGEFFGDLSELTLKGAGFEASFRRKQTEAAVSLTTAEILKSLGTSVPEGSKQAAEAAAAGAARTVADALTPRVLRRAKKSTVLWVDDEPANNIHERAALEAVGVQFVLATSTEHANALLKQRRFDAIISDMGRPEGRLAGYTLLEGIRKNDATTPFIVYSSSSIPEHREMAKQKGAVDSISRPDELFRTVLSVLADGRSKA